MIVTECLIMVFYLYMFGNFLDHKYRINQALIAFDHTTQNNYRKPLTSHFVMFWEFRAIFESFGFAKEM